MRRYLLSNSAFVDRLELQKDSWLVGRRSVTLHRYPPLVGIPAQAARVMGSLIHSTAPFPLPPPTPVGYAWCTVGRA